MKVLVLNPPRRDNIVMVKEGRCMQRKGAWGYMMAPLTMVTVATMLRDHGHAVTVADCPADSIDFEPALSLADSLAPDIVLINTSTPSIEDDLHFSAVLREKDPSVKTAAFGIHPSCMYEEVLSTGKIDFCIVGEPEFTILALIETLQSGGDISRVNGLAYTDTTGAIVKTEVREYNSNLDSLPLPDWSLVNLHNYRLPLNNEPFLLVGTNRGCPYRCSFCNAYVYYGRAPRRRSVSHIIREITNNVRRFGVTNFMFWAEEFILDKLFVMELCDAIKAAGLDIHWVCNSRVDAVDRETLLAIRNAGCWNIAYGIESGNQQVLDDINKGITLRMIIDAVKTAKEVGLQVTGHVILGFPSDTVETMQATEQFINSLDLDFVQYYCAMPYPGTDLYAEAFRNGWLNTDDWKQWEHNYSVLDFPHLKAYEVMNIRKKMLRRFYFNPHIVAKTLKAHMKRPSDLLALLSRVPGFIKWM